MYGDYFDRLCDKFLLYLAYNKSIKLLTMLSSESEDYKESNFDLMQCDCEPSDNSDSDISDDISDNECERIELSGGWKRVPEIFVIVGLIL